jgi:hypothetical protein
MSKAADLLPMLTAASDAPPRTLELGSGGSPASHFKPHFQLTLSDISPEMLAMSRQVNWREHVPGTCARSTDGI